MADEYLSESMQKAHETLKDYWAWEREHGKSKDERLMRYTITLECTYSQFQEIRRILEPFHVHRRWYRQEEIPRLIDEADKNDQEGSEVDG